MTTDWNERYAQEEYVYGTAPNEFFRQQIETLKPGKLLLPAEGEGRNAVFAALKGWEVFAFDSSEQAKKKAEKLAIINNVNFVYEVFAVEDFTAVEETYDAAALIFVHLPEEVRKEFFRKVHQSLKTGGHLIVEVFSVNQLGRSSGGPKVAEFLYSKEQMETYLSLFNEVQLEEKEVFLDEGSYHKGLASVIQAIAKK